MTTRALVLGGGGVAGIGWELGLLSGWAAEGVDVRQADLVVGTSAGSIVGTLLRTENDVQASYERQLAPVGGSEPQVQFDAMAMMTAFAEALAGVSGQQEGRARIGALALQAATVPEAERRAIIEGRIGDPEWPGARLVATAVDTVDGGMRSVTNADVVTGCEKVLIVTPTSGFPNSPLGPTLEQEVEILRWNADVHVVLVDQSSLTAFGTNPLDPATREPSARAGRAQAAATVKAARAFWG